MSKKKLAKFKLYHQLGINSSKKKPVLAAVRSPVEEAYIFVCEKCGRNLDVKGQDDISQDFQKRLKETLKDRLGKKIVRPVLTSCLDLCPKGKIAIGISCVFGSSDMAFYEVDPKDIDTVIEEIVDRFEAK